MLKGTIVFSSLLLLLSGTASAEGFYKEAAPGSNTAGNSSKEKPGDTISSADNTAANNSLQENGFSDQGSPTSLPPVLISISPESGDRLQTLEVVFTGTNLQLLGETTAVNVGNGITVNSQTVSPLEVRANLTITAAAAAGPREFSITTTGLLGGTSNPKTFTVNNPAPTLVNIEPKSGNRLATLAVVLTGTNFISGVSAVSFGSDITVNSTRVDDAAQITANITVGATAALGARDVSVSNPAPGGATATLKNGFNVRVGNNPVPTLTSLLPSSKTVGDAEFTMTVNGTNFVPESVVRFNASDRATTYVNGTQLNATIPASDLATAETFEITVFTPSPGGGTSNALPFTVNVANNPVPTTTSISPASKTVGDALFTMTVNGTGFVSGAVVRFEGANRSTTVVNSTQLNVTILESDLTTAGTFEITVFNPAPGGGVSNAQTFTVNNPIPTTSNISPFNKTVGDAEFMMTVNGASFVPQSVVRLEGSTRSTTFISSTRLTATIPASDLTTAGTFNVTVSNPTPGGGISNAQTFTVSPVGNPLPTLTGISPASKTVGEAQFTMTVSGANFVSGAAVRFNGSERTTTFINGTQLTATILASDLTAAGMFDITVLNPPPGGGISNAQTFTVSAAANPVPTLTSVLPASKTVGDAGFNMIVSGTKFVSGSVVRFNGANRMTAFVSSTELSAAIPESDLAAAGTFNITVFNPPPGGGASNTLAFTVNPPDNPVPTLSGISPSSKTVGDAGFTLTVIGTNFILGSVVRFNDSSRTTTFVNNLQLTAAIPPGDLATAGTFNITVLNPTPGGGTSAAQVFTVSNPLPSTTSISPSNKLAGETEFMMTVNGTSFVPVSVVRWNGSNRATTFVNATQLNAAIPASDLTDAGTFDITVFNPTPGGGTSNAQTFTVIPVDNPVPTLSSISPTSKTVNDAEFALIVNGAGFVPGSVVRFDTSARMTSFVNSGRLTAIILAGDLTTAGTFDITVSNPPPGGGTSQALTFTVNNPVPTLTRIDPTTGGRLQTLEVVFTGTNFIAGASAVEVGQGIAVDTTTVASSTTLKAILTIARDATLGARNFSVTNRGPGGGRSGNLTFTVKENKAPSITHTPSSPQQSGEQIQVDAIVVDDDSDSVIATLHYRRGGEVNFSGVAMERAGNDSSFQKTIPASAVTARGVEYFITATDAESLRTRLPLSGIFSIQIHVNNEVKPTAQPHGSVQNAYRLISVPLDLDDKSSGAVLEDDLGKYDDTKWRFSELLANQTYAEFPQTSPMAPGKAFWLIAAEPGKTIGTGAGKSNWTGAKYAVGLHPQWNFIGNPFNFAIPVENLRLKGNGQSPDLYFYNGTWNDPVSTPVATMIPFDGYALYNATAAVDTLFIDPDLSSGGTPNYANHETLWSIRISAQSRQARDVNNIATVVATASRARDRRDHPEPPGVGEYVSVYFPHRDWALSGPGYCTDARPEFSRGEIWEFEVASNIRDQVDLTFDGVAQVPEEFEVWVMDEALQLSQNLRESNRYAVAGSGLEHPRQLKLIVGRTEFVAASLKAVKVIPASYELSQNFPNPFNPATTIRYGLPKAERVTLKIYNLLGEEVVALVDDESKEPGYHAAIWDGRNQHGQPVASGIYIYQLRAESFRSTKKMVLMQ